MTRIVELEIENFRGISTFSQKFNRDVVCLVGRGDAGKSTMLDAIIYVLSSAWNLPIYDTDFYGLNTSNPLVIRVTLFEVPEELLTEGKYGLFIKGFSQDTGSITPELSEGFVPALTIELRVEGDLEPKWHVLSGRAGQTKEISSRDRAKLNCFMISDYVDSHFSWNKGNPLYALFKSEDPDEQQEKLVLEALREAKSKLDSAAFDHFESVTGTVKDSAARLGLNVNEIQTTLDFKDINIKEGKVSLHLGNVPFRLMGKGSRRLASMAIQTAIARSGGIALIDEIEQGLEPDRIKHVVRALKAGSPGQVIMTTHSRDVVTELEVQNLLVLHSDRSTGALKSEYLDIDNGKLKGVVRACPEAFFATKVIVCEGATEVGICRAIDQFRIASGKTPMSFNGCAYVDGTGSSFSVRAMNISEAEMSVSVLCDSDIDPKLNPSKDDMKGASIEIFDCDSGNSIEAQVFQDLPWNSVLEAVDYVMQAHGRTAESIDDALKTKRNPATAFSDNWRESDTGRLDTNGYFPQSDMPDIVDFIDAASFDPTEHDYIDAIDIEETE